MNIILIGFKNCGKTSVGQSMAKKMAAPFIDTDNLIEQHYYNLNNRSLSTNEIYQKHGENYFRELEANIINDLKDTEKSVIATGGGSLLNPDNIITLKKLGEIIYLLIPFYLIEIRNRLQPKPAFLNDQFTLADIYEQRKDIYSKAANIIINAENKSIDIIADEIILFIKA